MRVKDLGIYGVILIVLLVGNSFFEVIPWYPHFAGLVGLLGLLVVYSEVYDGTGIDFTFSGFSTGSSGSSGPELEVEPVDAPEELNKKVRDSLSYRALKLDKTSEDNLDYYVDTQTVDINGSEKFVMGLVGKPRNHEYGELIAYIYNLTDDRIEQYNGQVKDIKGRVQPFENKHTWFKTRGVNAKSQSSKTGRNQFIIDQSGESRNRRSSGSMQEGDN